MEQIKKEMWTANYEEGIKESLQYPEVNLFNLLERTVRRYPRRVATYFEGSTISYGELLDYVNKFAAALAGLGVKKGDRVGVFLPNSPQAVISYYALMRLGVIAVMINPLNVERELRFLIRDAGIKDLIVLDTLYRKVMNIKDKIEINNLIIAGNHDFLNFPNNIIYPIKQRSKGRAPDIPYHHKNIHSFKKLLRNAPASPPEVEVNPREDVAILQYTGGVTGTPKAAMLTHHNMVAGAMQFREWCSVMQDGEERIMGALPMSAIYFLNCVLNFGISIGATLVLVPRFNVEVVLKLIAKTRPTFFPGVPTMYVAFNNHPDLKKYDLSSVKYWTSGGAPLPMDVMERFEYLTGGRLIEGYGLAEAAPTHFNTVQGRRKVGSIGLPLSDTMVKIVDLEDPTRELEVKDVGELAISGPQVMKGYWNKPEETDLVIRDGWLHTGDIAEMDEDGFFYIINRKKDMVISGGYNIYPREVEAILQRHPKIKEAIIVGVPDDYYGEISKAYIFCKGDKLMFEDEILDYCLNKLASYKIPKVFEIRKLPRGNLRGAALRRYLIEESKKKR